MEHDSRFEYTDLIKRIMRESNKFEFFQLLRLLPDITRQSLRFVPSKSRQFPTSDIQRIVQNDIDTTLILNFMGLYGVDSPLSHYITDLTIKDDKKSETFRDFLNIFNQRFYTLLFAIWEKYRSYVQAEKNNSSYLQYLKAISGNVLKDADRIEFAYSGLLGAKTKNSQNLRAILKDFLGAEIQIFSFVPFWVQLTDLQHLGIQLYLGNNSILGERALDAATTIHIAVGPIHYTYAKLLLLDRFMQKRLRQLIERFLGPLIRYHLELIVIPSQEQALCLGKDEIYLGWCARLGASHKLCEQNLVRLILSENQGGW